MSQSNEKNSLDKLIEINKSLTIDAPPEVVFRAVTHEEDFNRWLPDKELFKWFPDQILFQADSREKKHLECFKKDSIGDHVLLPQGTVIELIPNKEVSYLWEKSERNTLFKKAITWTIESLDNGRTKLTLLQTGIDGPEMSERYDVIWTDILNKLGDYCKAS